MRIQTSSRTWLSRLLNWRLMLPVNLVLIAFIGWNLMREVGNGAHVNDQLQQLNKEIAQLDAENGEYSSLIAKLGTSAFVEREARLKLGYQKPGEQTLVLQDISTASTDAVSAPADAPTTNPGRWWQYFFGS
jgi:cell division protein FtsB